MSVEIRNVTLYCPTCGNDHFSCLDTEVGELSEAPPETRLQCADCKSIFTKAELIEENQDIINANIEEVEQNLMKDLEKKLKRLFK